MSRTPISRQGYDALRSEYNQLFNEERPRIIEEVAFAAAQGDRSENAEYTFGKRKLREIDRRLTFLQRRLDSVTVIETAPQDRDTVRFGATVEMENERGRQMTATLVGKDEIAPMAGRFSLESPLGQALLGHHAGESVTVIAPRGKVTWTIKSISYL